MNINTNNDMFKLLTFTRYYFNQPELNDKVKIPKGSIECFLNHRTFVAIMLKNKEVIEIKETLEQAEKIYNEK